MAQCNPRRARPPAPREEITAIREEFEREGLQNEIRPRAAPQTLGSHCSAVARSIILGRVQGSLPRKFGTATLLVEVNELSYEAARAMESAEWNRAFAALARTDDDALRSATGGAHPALGWLIMEATQPAW